MDRGARVAVALFNGGVVTMIVLSIISVVAGAGLVLVVVLSPWCDADLASCQRAAQGAGGRRFAVLLAAGLCFATPVLPVLFRWATRSRPVAPRWVAGWLLGCLGGYLVPVAVLLLGVH